MKKIETFEDAKQAVAEKHSKSCWEWLTDNKSWDGLDDLCREAAELLAESRSRKAANEAVKAIFQFRPADEWEEEMGQCLWYTAPVCEAPTVTSPISCDWIEDYYTHFLDIRKFPVLDEDGNSIPGNSRDKYWTPFPEEA